MKRKTDTQIAEELSKIPLSIPKDKNEERVKCETISLLKDMFSDIWENEDVQDAFQSYIANTIIKEINKTEKDLFDEVDSCIEGNTFHFDEYKMIKEKRLDKKK